MNRSTANTPTRERILNAAMEVFAARGYHGTVVDTITAASGTSKGAFYHYFPSKQAIFLTLMDELASDVEHGVELVIASEQGALAKVEAALQVVLETAAARRDLVRILLIEAVGLGPTLEGARLGGHRVLRRARPRPLCLPGQTGPHARAHAGEPAHRICRG